MQYQIKENCLTIFLPAEVDHHNAEEIKREADKAVSYTHLDVYKRQVLNTWMAGRDRGLQVFLSDRCTGNRL